MKTPRGALRQILMVLAGFILLLILGLAIVLMPDQMRAIPDPAAPGRSTEAAAREKIPENPQENKTHSPSSISSISSPPAPDHSTLGDSDDLAKAARPFPDLSQLPEHLRPKAAEFNRAADQITSRILAMPETLGNNADHLAFILQSSKLQQEYNKLIGDCALQMPEQTGKALDQLKRIEALRPLLRKVGLQLAVNREDWMTAALICRSQEPGAWDQEAYYWRKEGGRGRAILAIRSFQRAFPSLTPYVFPDLAPEFKAPM